MGSCNGLLCTADASNNDLLSLLYRSKPLPVQLIKISHFDQLPGVCGDSKDVRGKRVFFERKFMVYKSNKLRTLSKTRLKGGSG